MSADFTSMNNPRFLYLAEMHHPFPDWVASQPVPEREDFEKKAATAFADPARRLLPICTKEAAFHSAINIFARPDDFEESALERVKSACAHYGIEEDILPYAELFVEEFDKSASLDEFPEGRFAIDTQLGGEDFKLLPLNDADDVITSAFDLAKMASENRIHVLMMVDAAREIVKAAEDHGVRNIAGLTARYGEPRHADAEGAARKLEGREQLCKDASIRATIAADYQEALDGLEDDPDAAMSKIAAIDHAAGLVANYKISSPVPTPYDIVFCGPLDSSVEKTARENVLVRDVLVPLAEMQKVTELDASYRLSKEAADAFGKLRDTRDARDLSIAVEQWPEDDQRTLLRLAVASA